MVPRLSIHIVAHLASSRVGAQARWFWESQSTTQHTDFYDSRVLSANESPCSRWKASRERKDESLVDLTVLDLIAYHQYIILPDPFDSKRPSLVVFGIRHLPQALRVTILQFP
jgi:hypothetical protein